MPQGVVSASSYLASTRWAVEHDVRDVTGLGLQLQVRRGSVKGDDIRTSISRFSESSGW